MTDVIRRTYMAFRSGAHLRSEDVKRLFESRGATISNNRLRELGRVSDRARAISQEELYLLISAWADEQHGPGRPPESETHEPS